jgi:23S rRNA pseudouridine1911/1915/1917 synthase
MSTSLPIDEDRSAIGGPDFGDEPITLRVGGSVKDSRLDKYLAGRLPDFSRRFIQEAIRAGTVLVNGKIVRQSFKLRPGDVICVTLPEPEPKEILPEDIPLNIIHEDNDIIILNKQADLLVHPPKANVYGTLVNALAFHFKQLSDGLGEFRPGIVHRLDRNTTGVMIVAKHNTAQWKIAEQFEYRTVNKTYLAIVHGRPDLTRDCISAPLGMHPTVRERFSIRPHIGKEAITFYEVAEAFRGFSLVRAMPKTGRTHQIRVHLSYIKHPIVADEIYGGKLVYPWQLRDDPAGPTQPEEPIIGRTALHAYSIEFRHPTTGQMVRFEAPLPEDMRNLLEMLRKYRRT